MQETGLWRPAPAPSAMSGHNRPRVAREGSDGEKKKGGGSVDPPPVVLKLEFFVVEVVGFSDGLV